MIPRACRRFASRVPLASWVSSHLSHFALWTTLSSSLVRRHSHDYYWDSVALGLAPRRPSHVPSLRNVENDVGSALMSLNSLIGHRPLLKASGQRNFNWPVARASVYRRATDECARSIPGHCGSGNPALALSFRRCRAMPYTSSVLPRFTNMLLSPPPFRVREVVRLGVIRLELRSPGVTIPSVPDMAHPFPALRSRLTTAP